MSMDASRFCWYELATPNTAQASQFYAAVFGWTVERSPAPDRHYSIIHANGIPIGGMFQGPPEMFAQGMPPNWLGYLAVNDVDAKAQAVQQAGGFVHRAAEDIPGVGRFAIVGDPQGAGMILFKPLPGDSQPTPLQASLGHVGWHELHASDPQAALAFYEKHFGWSKADRYQVQTANGTSSDYQNFATGSSLAIGGVVQQEAQMPFSYWLYYINVDSISAAIARVQAAGGTCHEAARLVPGGHWIASACQDTQGAWFAMVSKEA